METRRFKHRPSPALVVATVALFVALGGAGMAATGGTFILGQPNTADKTTALSVSTLPDPTVCRAPCQTLQVTDTSSATNAGALGVINKSAATPAATFENTAGAPALRLKVTSGKPPFAVSSSGKVAALNADFLDGKDSTGFLLNKAPLVLTGTTASDGVITGKAVGGANGVQGVTDVNTASGVYGENNGGGAGVAGRSNQPGGTGVLGEALGSGGIAGRFLGNVSIEGALSITSQTKVDNLNADQVDGIDQVVQGPGKLLRNAVALGPDNCCNYEVLRDPGYWRVGYLCPDPLTNIGVITFKNETSETMNLFIDNGGSNPEYLQLVAGDRADRAAAPGGEWYTFQFHSSKGITQVSVFSVHRSSDCHIQAQAIETP